MKEYPSRRTVLQAALASLGLPAWKAVAQSLPPGTLTISAEPYPDLDYKDWPVLTEQEKKLLGIELSPQEAENLMTNMLNRHILENTAVIARLKELGIIRNNVELFLAKKAMSGFGFSGFYDNVLKEYKEHNPWGKRSEGERITVGNLWPVFWRRVSAHYHETDIGFQFDLHNGKSLSKGDLDTIARLAIALGPAEKLRGDKPLDFTKLAVKNKNAAHQALTDEARRRPQLDFPGILTRLGIAASDLLRITRQNLERIGIKDIDKRISDAAKRNPSRASLGSHWVQRTGSAPSASERSV